MTKKEFLNHDWKDGEYIYRVGYRRYGCYEIPLKVMRVKVTFLSDKSFYGGYCKKDTALMKSEGFFITLSRRFYCQDLFLTKSEAQEYFRRKYFEFQTLHVDKLYRHLVDELKELDDEKRAIWGVMRMKIMRKDNGEGSNS